MEKKIQDIPFSLKDINEAGYFSGYASVFDVCDQHNDVILPGAFHDGLASSKNSVKLLWQHLPHEPIGMILSMKEDAQGLFIEARLLLDVQRAKEAYALLKEKAVTGLSIGFHVMKESYDAKNNCRLLHKIKLWEISLVTFPANHHAHITCVKKYDKDALLWKNNQEKHAFRSAIERAISITQ